MECQRRATIIISLLLISNSITLIYFYPKEVAPPGGEKFAAYEEVIRTYQGDPLALPEPERSGFITVEEAIASRRSRRKYSHDPLALPQVSQLLWAAQGITSEDGKRTTPSAGAIYPLKIYLVARNVHGFENGVYHYIVEEHKLGKLLDERVFEAFFEVAGQPYSKKAAVTFIITVNYPKVAQKYKGEELKRFALQESGHVGQNLYLQGESLGLAMVVVGEFDTQGVKEVLDFPDQETAVYLIPVGSKMLE